MVSFSGNWATWQAAPKPAPFVSRLLELDAAFLSAGPSPNLSIVCALFANMPASRTISSYDVWFNRLLFKG